MKQQKFASWALTGAFSLLLASPSAQAASSDWNVDAAGNWIDAPNWTAGVPGIAAGTDSTDIATFGMTLTAARTVTVDANRNIGGITFSNSSAFGYTLATGLIRLSDGGVIQTASGNGNHNDTITSAIQIQGDGGSATFTGGATSNTSLLRINSAITGVSTGSNVTTLNLDGSNVGTSGITGAVNQVDGSITGKVAIVKSGSGTWQLTGGNSGMTGGVTVKNGILYVTTASAFGSGTITLGDSSGSNSAFIGNDTSIITNDIVVAAGSSGTLTLAGAGNTGAPASPEFSGNITLNNDVTLLYNRASSNGTRSLTVSGVITGDHTVTAKGLSSVNNTSRVYITNSGNGTAFTGDTHIDTATLIFSNNALGNGVSGQGDGKIVFIGDGVLQWAAGNTQDLSSKTIDSSGFTGTLDLGANNVTFAGTNGLTGTGNFTKFASAGILTLAAANDFSGTYTSSAAGTTLLQHANALQNAVVAVATGGITFDSSVGSHAFTFGGLTGAGNLALLDNGSNAVSLTLGGSQSPAAYTGILSGGGSLTKQGTGTLLLSGANTFSGGVTINNGIVSAGFAGVAGVSGPLGTGATVVNSAGELRATAASALLGPSSITLAGGTLRGFNSATINYGGNITVTANSNVINERAVAGGTVNNTYGTLSIGTNTLSVTSANTFTSGTAGVTFGATTLTGNTTFDVTNNSNATDTTNLTLGALTDGGGSGRTITKTGNGTLTLATATTGMTGSSGSILVSGGTLALGNATAIGSYSLNFAANTALDASVATTLSTVNAQTWNSSLRYGGTSTLNTGTGAVSISTSSFQLTNQGASALTVGGAVSGTSNLTLTVNAAGGLSFANLGTSGTITTSGAGTGGITLTNMGSGITGLNHGSNGNLTVTAGTIGASSNLVFSGTGAGTVTYTPGINTTGTITNNGTTTGTTTINGIISNAATVVTQNSATSNLTLGGVANSFAGGLNILQGRVTGGGNANTFGANSNIITLGTAGSSANASLFTSSSQIYAQAIQTAANSTGVLSMGGGAGNANFSGGITLNNSNLQFVYSGGSNVTISGAVSGTGNLAINNTTNSGVNFTMSGTSINNAGTITNSVVPVTGASTTTISGALGANVTKVIQNSSTASLTLSGNNASFAGDIEVAAGTLRTGSSTAVNASNTVSVASGATFDINNLNETVEGLNDLSGGGGTVTNSGAAVRTLTLGGSGAYAYGGAVTATTAANLNLAVTGGGTQTLSGANSYAGTTVVSSGTLLINGTHTGAGAYSVGASGTLGGIGTITGATNAGITLASGAKLAPGSGGAGTTTAVLSGTGSLDLSAAVGGANTGALVFQLASTSDQFVLASGTLAIGSGQLEFSDFSFSNIAGFGAGTYVLFDAASAISGTLGSSLSGTVGGLSALLSLDDTNNDILLTVSPIPEPSTYALLGGGLATLAFLRRRKKV